MKKLSLLILAFAFAYSAQAQLHGYKWRFGASAGTTNYFGDIRPLKVDNVQDFTQYYKRYKTYSDQLSYQLSIEYALGNSVGLMLTGGSYQFGSSDRLITNDGNLLTENPKFDRALNFQTDVYDAGLSFVIKPDNNWLLSGKSFFSPYITIGAGVQTFKVYGDLLDANGSRYDYTNPNVIPDGNFETDLTTLGTESSDNYETTSLYANLGLGVRFRITKTVEIFAQSDFKRTNTDYLDDVSGLYRTSYENGFQNYAAKPGTNVVTAENPYRGMKNGQPDWYIYHGIGIKFSLGANKTAFNPPVITQRYTYIPTELSNAQLTKEKVSEKSSVSPGVVTNNYFTVIQLPGNGQPNFTNNQTSLDSASLMQVNATLDSLEKNLNQLNDSIASTKDEIYRIDQTLDLALQDSSLSSDDALVRIQNLVGEKSIAQRRMTNLDTLALDNQFKLDSLNALKSATAPTAKLDYESMMHELLIYPGQMSRIIYSSSPAILSVDSARQSFTTAPLASPATVAERKSETMTGKEFDEKMLKFQQALLTSQASRDSAMINSFAPKMQVYEANDNYRRYPEEYYYSDELNDRTSKRLERNIKKQERLETKNNELLKDALLVGGTVAATAAISSSGDKKKEAAVAANDSSLLARIAIDSALIDSLSNMPRIVDTVTVTEIQERTVETLLPQNKVEVYFAINKSNIIDQERDKLIQIIEILKKNPGVSVELVGFADNTGTVAYNLALTEKRVEAVTNMLTEYYKIEPTRISISNGGLIVRGKSKSSVETDRKVEIRIMKK